MIKIVTDLLISIIISYNNLTFILIIVSFFLLYTENKIYQRKLIFDG